MREILTYNCKCGAQFTTVLKLADHQFKMWKIGDPLGCCQFFSPQRIRQFQKKLEEEKG